MNRGIPLPGLRWRGLTLQLFLFTILPLTLLLLGVVWVSLTLHHNSMRELVGDRDLRAVRSTATSLEHEIVFRATTLQLLAGRVGESLEDADPIVFDGGLARFDAAGRRLDASPRAAGPLLDWAQLTTLPAAPLDDGSPVRLTEPFLGADGGWWVVALAPTPDGGVLAGAFSPASVARSALVGVAGPQTMVLLVSRRGEMLYHAGGAMDSMDPGQQPGVAEVLRGESGVNYTGGHEARDIAADGEIVAPGEIVAAFAPIQQVGWGLVMAEPWEASAGPLLRATQTAPLLLAPVLLLALLALWFGARQVVQPLQALESRAARLAGGDFAAIRRPVGGINEIRHLQDTLADMARELQAAQASLHGYIGALTAGVENERRSLARELHDDTLQALIALNQNVQMALLQTQDPQQRQPLLDLQGRVVETIANLRRAIAGLRPIYLEDLGLVAALGMLARGEDGSPVGFTVQGAERRLPPEAELAFYRIAQEALNNALHHGQANQVTLELAFLDGTVRLAVCDDGQGFQAPSDPNAFARQGHFGLLGMRERAELAGAVLEIDSQPGAGTRVVVTLEDDQGAG